MHLVRCVNMLPGLSHRLSNRSPMSANPSSRSTQAVSPAVASSSFSRSSSSLHTVLPSCRFARLIFTLRAVQMRTWRLRTRTSSSSCVRCFRLLESPSNCAHRCTTHCADGGEQEPNDEFAAKASGHDLKGATYFFRLHAVPNTAAGAAGASTSEGRPASDVAAPAPAAGSLYENSLVLRSATASAPNAIATGAPGANGAQPYEAIHSNAFPAAESATTATATAPLTSKVEPHAYLTLSAKKDFDRSLYNTQLSTASADAADEKAAAAAAAAATVNDSKWANVRPVSIRVPMQAIGQELQREIFLPHLLCCVVLCCTRTVDYRGVRLIAMPLLPVHAHSLIYGSNDGGRTVHADYPGSSPTSGDTLLADLGLRICSQLVAKASFQRVRTALRNARLAPLVRFYSCHRFLPFERSLNLLILCLDNAFSLDS